jgi:nucleotidyltransferase substrate binding protein (TIGR01987 family)
MIEGIRWIQRFNSFSNAMAWLTEAVDLKQQRQLSHIELQGFIKSFEFTHELAWNVIKDFAHYQGQESIMGSRDATRYAFKLGLIDNGEEWMQMIISRNKAVHAYDEKMANEVVIDVVERFYPLFVEFKSAMQKKVMDNNGHTGE